MNKNKTGKYFKYAIGEIILVVIGILIALQINNWNEQRKNENLKRNYLESLINDLEKDSAEIHNRIIYSKEWIAEYERYEKKFSSTDLTYTETLQAISKNNGSTLTSTFKTNTIEILKSTGDIKLIPEKIRNKAMDLYREQVYSEHIIKRNTAQYLENQQVISKMGWNRTNRRIRKNTYMNELADKYLYNDEKKIAFIYAVESVYLNKYNLESTIMRSYESILEKIADLKALIKLELV
jgi:hypothetical protein